MFRSRGIVPDDSLITAFVGRRGTDVHGLLREGVPGHDRAELMAATSAISTPRTSRRSGRWPGPWSWSG